MGYGDEIMASHYAKGAAKRGKRIAFGNGERIIHHRYAAEIFRNNPNVAAPGSEGDRDIEWIKHSYRGNRPYVKQWGNRWLFQVGYANRPGEIFFDEDEIAWANKHQTPKMVIIEPNVPAFKTMAPNKQWRQERYSEVAHHLIKEGYDVVQFIYGPGYRIPWARALKSPNFRYALALLSRAKLFIGPEGGMHHGAAAVGTPGVVIFGGFISPKITGYSFHRNIFTGNEPCGSFHPCPHCRTALDKISVKQVFEAAMECLDGQGTQSLSRS